MVNGLDNQHLDGIDADIGDSFSPEFSGRKAYDGHGPLMTTCNHGVVVGELFRELERLGLAPFNTKKIDMCLRVGNKIVALLEVKTDVTSTSIYTAVGQSMIHSAVLGNIARKVIVLPEMPPPAMTAALKALDISLLVYSWQGGRPIFPHIGDLYSSLRL